MAKADWMTQTFGETGKPDMMPFDGGYAFYICPKCSAMVVAIYEVWEAHKEWHWLGNE